MHVYNKDGYNSSISEPKRIDYEDDDYYTMDMIKYRERSRFIDYMERHLSLAEYNGGSINEY